MLNNSLQVNAQINDSINVEKQKINPWSNLELNNNPDHFQFAIVSDRTGDWRSGVFEDAIRKLNLLQPEFVMSVGDLIEGYTNYNDILNYEWDEFTGFISQLEMPFFYVPGNHDIYDIESEKVWMERFGKPYYHFIYKNVLFLCLNTQDVGEGHDYPYITQKQREYVKRILDENTDVRWTFVFMHQPLWAYPPEMFEEEEDEDSRREETFLPRVGGSGWPEIEGQLRQRKHTVFAGHAHRYVHFNRNNSDYIVLATTGGGRKKLRGPLHGEFDHIMMVSMMDEAPRIANLMLDGILEKKISEADIEAIIKNTVIRCEHDSPNEGDEDEFYNGSSATMLITNDADIPMKINMKFLRSENIRIIPEKATEILEPNSVKKIKINFETEKPLTYDLNRKENINTEAVSCDWFVEYDDTMKGKMEISGNYRIIILE